MKDAFTMLFILIAMTGGMLGTAGFGAYYLGKQGCEARWGQSGRDSSYGFFQGCLVESDGKFVPQDRIWYERN